MMNVYGGITPHEIVNSDVDAAFGIQSEITIINTVDGVSWCMVLDANGVEKMLPKHIRCPYYYGTVGFYREHPEDGILPTPRAMIDEFWEKIKVDDQ